MLEEPWCIKLLGRLSAETRTATIARFRTQQTGALLARLALFPRRLHSREELADLLWPDDDPDTARAKLRIALSSLRRQLEPPGAGRGSVLQADRLTVRLNPAAVTTDVAQWEAILARIPGERNAGERKQLVAQAEALYAGELLPGFYDDWIVAERERLEALADQIGDGGEVGAGREPSPGNDGPQATVSLPPQWTRFFGRTAEAERIHNWLVPPEGEAGARLVTLTGPGGVGKSRLALEAARAAAGAFPRGVYFLGLADVREADRLFPLIAARLPLADALPDNPRRTILEKLAGGPALLVLDNLEQMADDIGPRVQSLLAQLPSLRCLTTSRQALNVSGEQVLLLSPLPTPAEDAPVTLDSPSVALFVDRGRAARSDFALTAGNAAAVGRLCARLDGLPLALELAAAWTGVLTPAQMLARLDAHAAPLISRRKDGAERHRTVQAAVAWSFDLLPAGLRETWAQLSVFRGGWTAEAVAVVCQTPDSLEALARLRDRSLILAEATEDGAAVRFRLLESLREFAQDQLSPAQRTEVARRHAAFFLQLAEAADEDFNGPQQAAALGRLEADQENLRAAQDWYASDPDGGPDCLRLAAALQRFWWVRGFFAEGRRRSAQALSHPAAPRDGWPRARTLIGVSVLARLQGDNDESRALLLECLEIVRPLDNPKALATVLGGLGNVAKNTGDFAAARDYYAECLDGARAAGLDRIAATALVNLGGVAVEQEQWDTARRHYDASLALMRRLDDQQGVVVALTNLAHLHSRTENFPAAHCSIAECLALCWDLMDKNGLTYALEVRAQLALAERQFPLAATLYAAAGALRRALDTPIPDSERAHYDRDFARLQASLNPSDYAVARQHGEALPLEDAVALALAGETGKDAGPHMIR